MLAAVEQRGLQQAYAHNPVIWRIAGFKRRS